MYYLETGSVNPFYNLAFEEYVLHSCLEGDWLILWQNDKTVVIGQNQNAEAEINRGFVEANGIHVVRRATGGGAVYHDLGNLNYSFITDRNQGESMERFTRPVVDALRGLGLNAQASGRNDILIDDKKISGTAQRIHRSRILHHGTLLFDSDPERIAGALRSDPEKFRSKSTPSVRSRVGNIRECLQRDMTIAEFWEYLKQVLSGDDLISVTLPEAALEQIRKIKTEKYDTWEWNFGRTPQFSLCRKQRLAGGTLEVQLEVTGGILAAAAFRGDFLSKRPLDAVEQALEGCRFCREDIAQVLNTFSPEDYFGTISPVQILETIFPSGDTA